MRWPADRDREFTEFVLAQRAVLGRVAALLVSSDAAKAEDVVQTALTRLYLASPRVGTDTVATYARRCVVNAALDDPRSLFSRRQQVAAELPEVAVDDPSAHGAAALVALLGTLPTGFTVSTEPAGWKLVSSDDYSFVLAPPGTPPAPSADGQGVSFISRIVVMLQGGPACEGDRGDRQREG